MQENPGSGLPSHSANKIWQGIGNKEVKWSLFMGDMI